MNKLTPNDFEEAREVFTRAMAVKVGKTDVLAAQLICWGLIQAGFPPPDDFAEYLDESCKVTGAWTYTECYDLGQSILAEMKKKG